MKFITPKQSRVKYLASLGCSYAEMATRMRLGYGAVFQLCQRAGVKAPRKPARSFVGVINLRRYSRKEDGRLMPSKVMAANIPMSAIRAAGLSNEPRLAYRVSGETIVIEKVRTV